MSEANKNVARRFFEEQDRLRGGPADALCAPGYQVTIGGLPPMDLAGHQRFSAMFHAAFPDLTHAIEAMLADGDQVAVRFTLRGMHRGSFMGIAPTGKAIAPAAMSMIRVADGKVAEIRAVFDQLGMLQQLGAIPAAGRPG